MKINEAAVLTSPSLFENSLDHLVAGMSYVDLRVRAAITQARESGLNPNDEFRGLYISEQHVDDLLAIDLGTNHWNRLNGNQDNGQSEPSTSTQLAGSKWNKWSQTLSQARDQWLARTEKSREAGVVMQLDLLVQRFALSPLELDILLIALASELDPRFERLFAYLQDDVTKKHPSIDLILNLLAGSYQESIRMRRHFSSDSPLFRSQLLYLGAPSSIPHATLLSHYVRPAAQIVRTLLGELGLDSKLDGSAKMLVDTPVTDPNRLPPAFIDRLASANQHADRQPPVYICIGGYGVGKREAARHIARQNSQPLILVDLAVMDQEEAGLTEGMGLVIRDGRMAAAALYLSSWDAILQDGRCPPQILQLLLDYPHPIIIAADTPWYPADTSIERRPVHVVQFDRPGFEHRLRLWQAHLADDRDGSLDLEHLANQFRFTPGQIQDAAATARDFARWQQAPLSKTDLFAACRAHSNQKLSTLATKIQPRHRWNDIVLPKDTLRQLKEMVSTVRQRPTVYGRWGFDKKLSLGKGLNTLFAGEPGTGKTMAADVMALELGLDLYKIDLSTVVSKYIGETEKNLDRIFTEADTSNAILFFDEADAIFGKRSEVKDSHDRYANIEISYLLQRMETFDGVVILATNLRGNLDEAFTRRLHFAVEFPFPEAPDRERIWQVNFPPETPVEPEVDLKLLAERFRLAGGSIRNIIMAAAFLAAEAGQSVGMVHLLHATRREFQKMGRLIDDHLLA